MHTPRAPLHIVVVEIQFSLRFLAASTSTISSEKISIVITNNFELYLLNTGDSRIEMEPGELMGFGPGSFSESTPG
jgi:hypothetical protein